MGKLSRNFSVVALSTITLVVVAEKAASSGEAALQRGRAEGAPALRRRGYLHLEETLPASADDGEVVAHLQGRRIVYQHGRRRGGKGAGVRRRGALAEVSDARALGDGEG